MISLLENNSFGTDLIFHGGDLSPATLINAYRAGLFPMPLEEGRIGWYCPSQRGVFLTVEGSYARNPIKISRSLRKSLKRFTYSINLAFEEVISNCADSRRPGSWITKEIREAYIRLNRMGWAHSFEVWSHDGGSKELAGGLYGVAIGGLFAGESMFHRRTDASKAALVALASKMASQGGMVIDTQWNTEHLTSLGAITIPRVEYLELVEEAIVGPLPEIFDSRYQGPFDLETDLAG